MILVISGLVRLGDLGHITRVHQNLVLFSLWARGRGNFLPCFRKGTIWLFPATIRCEWKHLVSLPGPIRMSSYIRFPCSLFSCGQLRKPCVPDGTACQPGSLEWFCEAEYHPYPELNTYREHKIKLCYVKHWNSRDILLPQYNLA